MTQTATEPKKRTKTVFGTSEIAHVWAHQLQDAGRTSNGSIYFDGKTIYSYGRHFPMATMVNDNLSLITYRFYSNSTTKHLSKVRSAISHVDKIYCYDPESAYKGYHTDNFSDWKQKIKYQIEKLAKAKKPEIYIGEITRLKNQVDAYCTHFEIPLPADLVTLLSTTGTRKYKELIAKRLKLEAEKKKCIQLLGASIFSKYVESYHSFTETTLRENLTSEEYKALSKYEPAGGFTTLLRTDGNTIFTSKGMELPANVAKRYFKAYLLMVKNGGCKGDCNYKMLDFSVASADNDGLIVGCHAISINEINYIADNLGWQSDTSNGLD